MTTGERIRTARLRAGLTQKELAAKLGIPYQGVGQWERNIRTPKISTLEKIAEALDVSTGYLIGHGSIDEMETDRLVRDKLAELITDETAPFLAEKTGMYITHLTGPITDPRTDSGARLTRALNLAIVTDCINKLANEALEPSESVKMGRKLMDYFNALNDDGKAKALERVEELTELQKYRA